MKKPACLLVLLLAFGAPAQAEYFRPVQNMSVDELQAERYGIREHLKYTNLMRRTAETIRDGACSPYWNGALRAKRELAEIPHGMTDWSYRAKRDAKLKENHDYLARYEACFSRELRRYPEIYNNALDPARSYDQFKAVYNKLAGQLNKLQARYYDLGQELRRRGIR